MMCARARFLVRPWYLALANPQLLDDAWKGCSPRARMRERARLIIVGLPVAFPPARSIAKDFPLLPVQQNGWLVMSVATALVAVIVVDAEPDGP